MPPCINATISIKKIATWFSKNEWGGKGLLDFFQKFIRFGSGILPLAFSEMGLLEGGSIKWTASLVSLYQWSVMIALLISSQFFKHLSCTGEIFQKSKCKLKRLTLPAIRGTHLWCSIAPLPPSQSDKDQRRAGRQIRLWPLVPEKLDFRSSPWHSIRPLRFTTIWQLTQKEQFEK